MGKHENAKMNEWDSNLHTSKYSPLQNELVISFFKCKMAFIQEGVSHNKSVVTYYSLVARITHRLDLSNEVDNVSELSLVPKIQAVKVERTKNKSV